MRTETSMSVETEGTCTPADIEIGSFFLKGNNLFLKIRHSKSDAITYVTLESAGVGMHNEDLLGKVIPVRKIKFNVTI